MKIQLRMRKKRRYLKNVEEERNFRTSVDAFGIVQSVLQIQSVRLVGTFPKNNTYFIRWRDDTGRDLPTQNNYFLYWGVKGWEHDFEKMSFLS